MATRDTKRILYAKNIDEKSLNSSNSDNDNLIKNLQIDLKPLLKFYAEYFFTKKNAEKFLII